MDSPSSGSTRPPGLVDERPEACEVRRATTGSGCADRGDVVVASFRGAIAADFAAFVGRSSGTEPILVTGAGSSDLAGAEGALSPEETSSPEPNDWGETEPTSLIVFLAPSPTEPERRWLADLLMAAGRRPIRFVGIVSTFRVHLDDPAAEEAERLALSLIRSSGIEARVAIFRPGHVLSPNSDVSRWLRHLGPLFPLVPRRLHTCFVEGEEFFAAVDAERTEGGGDGAVGPDPEGRAVDRRQRAYTLLGANLPWREVLWRHRGASVGRRAAAVAAKFLSWLLLGQLVALLVAILARRFAWAKPWSVRTLKPRSMSELISLCHRENIERVRVVGYNNGVNHFGHRYPGKTIVSTVRCRRVVHAGPGMLKADCGATIRGVRDYLDGRGEELYVVPNYSYVAIGTAYFVPIHGSAVDYSTVAETACRVVLYDPDRDRIVSASSREAAFRENVYNLRSRVVVLRLYLRTRPKSSYFARREIWRNPGAGEILEALRDRDAANVEIRQAHAASDKATVTKYYTSPNGPSGPALESPRDALGRLWDRLEENPVSSFLMHALSRHVAWHTELFFTTEQFERFWATHAEVPLRKIQLRYIRRDGMPHSPFRDEDCVSADLFLLRYDKPAFDAYLRRSFPSIRTNPGKHSN